jgi:hypothetical protein
VEAATEMETEPTPTEGRLINNYEPNVERALELRDEVKFTTLSTLNIYLPSYFNFVINRAWTAPIQMCQIDNNITVSQSINCGSLIKEREFY